MMFFKEVFSWFGKKSVIKGILVFLFVFTIVYLLLGFL